jgi:hypothetical protein
MNLTLFFNALNSIQDYVGANDEYNSSLYISEFAGLMRKTLKLTKANYYTRRRSGLFKQLYLH